MAIRLIKLGVNRLSSKSDLKPGVSAMSNVGYNDLNYLVRRQPTDRSRWLRFAVIGAIVAIWLTIAVMAGFWWMNRSRSASEPLDPQYQRMFVKAVAQRYWQTSDLGRAQRDLISWREQDLTQLLVTMQGETKDPETRKQLAVLAAALRLPSPQTPAIYSLFSREIILAALVIALIPLLVAAGIVAAPYLKSWRRKPGLEELPAQEEDAEKLEELLPDLPLQEQTAEPKEENKEEEKKDAEEAPKEEEEEKAGELGDLASLFEEEDTSLSVLEQFTKGMPEVSIDDLIKNSKASLRQLLGLNSSPANRS